MIINFLISEKLRWKEKLHIDNGEYNQSGLNRQNYKNVVEGKNNDENKDDWSILIIKQFDN